MDGYKSVSSEQFRDIAPPKAHSADDNFNGRTRPPEAPKSAYREPASAGDNGPGEAWKPSVIGTGRPVTPMSSGYMRPIVSA